MKGTISIRSVVNGITEWIEPVYGKREAVSIAHLILEKLFGLTFNEIHNNREITLASFKISVLNEYVHRLLKHEPVQYIIGEAFFYDRWFKVNPSVLIPRSETEELCRLIINENPEPGLRVLDAGTGSGCIAIILGLNLNSPDITAWDISPGAIKTARENAVIFDKKIDFAVLDIFNLKQPLLPFNLVVSNPPYVRRSESKSMNRNVLDYEPENAIFVTDNDPLIFYKKILSLNNEILYPGGRIYFEINESFGQEIQLLLSSYKFSEIRIIKDIHGKDRIATARKL
jgi:release factor glutamine methyltransferase